MFTVSSFLEMFYLFFIFRYYSSVDFFVTYIQQNFMG